MGIQTSSDRELSCLNLKKKKPVRESRLSVNTMATSNLSKAVAILAITAAWAIGVYGVFFIGANNGLFNSISVGIERRHFPGCPAPFKMKYTGSKRSTRY